MFTSFQRQEQFCGLSANLITCLELKEQVMNEGKSLNESRKLKLN